MVSGSPRGGERRGVYTGEWRGGGGKARRMEEEKDVIGGGGGGEGE